MSQLVDSTHDGGSLCPSCRVIISPQALREWRPFSCPNCRLILAPRSAYHIYGTIGCWSVLILCAAGLYFISLRRFWVISALGFFAGLILAVVVANLIVRVLGRWVPRPPRLVQHLFYVEPGTLAAIADFLDSIYAAREWTPEFDKRLDMYWRSRSLDDALENATVEAVEEFRRRLVHSKPNNKRKIDKALERLTLDELRKELQAIVMDLRIGAG